MISNQHERERERDGQRKQAIFLFNLITHMNLSDTLHIVFACITVLNCISHKSSTRYWNFSREIKLLFNCFRVTWQKNVIRKYQLNFFSFFSTNRGNKEFSLFQFILIFPSWIFPLFNIPLCNSKIQIYAPSPLLGKPWHCHKGTTLAF